jgi:hypothetical protein
MKQEENNEMDLLLRNLGRTVEAYPNLDDSDEQHLDADELNAYAEKALPPAAHARYTKHIADCSRCRGIVAQLSITAGMPVEEKKIAPVVAPWGIKAFLASLFSPVVLRYSVPAMALVIVAAVGVLMFRQSTEKMPRTSARNASPNEVAQNPDTKGFDSLDQKKTEEFRTGIVADGRVRTSPSEAQPEAPKEDKNSSDDTRAKNAKSEPTIADQVSATPSSAPAANAAEPPPAPKPTPVPADEPVRKRVDPVVAPAETVTIAKSNDKEAEKPATREAKAPVKIAQPVAGVFGGSSGPSKAKSEAARGRADAARDEEGERRQERDKDKGEIKSVGGRRFRREGSTWIDVAYSSQETTNVSRGSEQYRALIADEPGIKTIADQLDGDVIILWKGRAYKIK